MDGDAVKKKSLFRQINPKHQAKLETGTGKVQLRHKKNISGKIARIQKVVKTKTRKSAQNTKAW